MSFIRRSAFLRFSFTLRGFRPRAGLLALIAALLGFAAPLQVHAATVNGTGWKGTAGSLWSPPANWDNAFPPSSDERSLFFGQGYFNAGNAGSTTANNDLSWSGHRITFQDITGQPDVSFTITGNGFTLFDFGGAFPKIENLSNVTQTFTLTSGNTITLSGGGAGKAEINPVNGNVTFSAGTKVQLNSPLDIFGNTGKTLTFNDVVSGGSGNPLTLQQNSIVALNAANTYAGNTNIKAGSVLIGANAPSGAAGALGNSTATVTLGDTTGAANASILTTGAFTVGRSIEVRSGNTGTITIGGDTAAASTYSGSITLGTASGTAKNVTLVAKAGGSVDFSGVINENTLVPNSNVTIGSATHTGTVKLSGTANNYGGVTTINGVVLEVTEVDNGGSGSSIGNAATAASNLVLSGGTLRFIGGGNASTNRLFTFDALGATLDATAAVSFTGTGGPLVASGTGNRTLSLVGSSTGSLASVIPNPSSGTTALSKSGGGTWTLSGANTYSGGTTLSAGAVAAGNGSALGTGAVTLSGGTLTNSGTQTITNAITAVSGVITAVTGTEFNVNGNITGSGNISLSAILNASGLQLGGNNSGFAGTATVTGANVRLNSANAGSASAAWVVDGNLQLNVAGTTTYHLGSLSSTVSTGGISGHATNGSPTVSTLSVGALNSNTSFSGIIVNNAAGNAATGNIDGASNNVLALTKVGTGTLTLSGANTYTGPTTITTGSLQLGDGGTTGSLSPSSTITNNGNLTINRSNAVTQGTDFSGSPITGTGTLTKSGAGTLTLTAANTYGGGTTINGGILFANNTPGGGSSATGGGAVTVENGGTLAGTGAVTGAVTVNGGGTLAPGNSIESLDIGASLTFNTVSDFDVELNTSTAPAMGADLVNVNGGLSILDGATLTLVDLNSAYDPGTKFTLISYAGTWDNGIFADKLDDSYVSVGLNTYLINYDDTSGGLNFGGGAHGNYLTLTAVPEASAFLFGGAACFVLGLAYGARVLHRRRAVAASISR